MVAPVSTSALVRSVHERRFRRVADVGRAEAAEQFGLLGAPDDVDQLHAVGQADALQHLPEVRRRRGVDEGGVTFHPHRLDHPQRRQWVDEARRTVGGPGAIRKREAHRRRQAPVLGIGRTADDRHRATEQRLGLGRRTGGHHDSCPLVADRHRLADPSREAAHRLRRDVGSHGGLAGGSPSQWLSRDRPRPATGRDRTG